MEAVRAGIEKTKEAVDAREAEKKSERANDTNLKPSERMQAQQESDKAATKAAEHHAKAEHHCSKHIFD